VLSLLGGPAIEYMDSCTSEPAHVWTKNLALNHTALLSEMAGIVMSADEPLEMDKWIEFIKDALCRLLKVDVPSRLILQVLSPMVPFHVAPTPANALHLLRSGWCCKLVGPALAAQTNRLLLAEIADVPVQARSDEALSMSVRQDLIATLENLHCGPQVDETQDNRPAQKSRRDSQSVLEGIWAKTAQVLFALKNRVAGTRVTATMADAADLIETLSSSSCSSSSSASGILDEMRHHTSLNRRLLLLDGAVDRCASDTLLSLREEGRLAWGGFGIRREPSKPASLSRSEIPDHRVLLGNLERPVTVGNL